MARGKKKVISVEADTSKINESIEESKEKLNSLQDKADDLTGGLVSGFKAVVRGVKQGVKAMTTLRTAVIATGVGALVVAVGSLVSYFQNTEEGAKSLRKAMAFLEILWKNLTDLASELGGAIVWAFENPQEAVKNLWESIKENITNRLEGMMKQFNALGKIMEGVFNLDWDQITEGATELGDAFLQTVTGVEDVREKASAAFDEIKKEIDKAEQSAERYANAIFNTRELIRKLTVENASLNGEIEKQQKIIDDTTLSFEERSKALQKQNKAREKLAENVAKQATAEKNLLEQQIAQTANDEEKAELKQQLAELQAGEIEALNALTVVRLENEQKTREIDLEEFERKKSILQTIQDLETQNIEDENKRYFEELKLEEERTLEELELLKATEEQKQAVRDAFAEQRVAKEKEIQDALDKQKDDADKKEIEDTKNLNKLKVKMALDAAHALGDLIGALSSDSERGARRRFAINKALGIADATVNTAAAIADALAKDGTGFPGSRFIAAATAGATGAAQIATIAKTKFTSTGGGGGGGFSAPSSSIGGGQSAPTAPTLDFDFLNQTPQDTIQAYVLETNVTNSQEANQLIQDQAKL